MDTSDNKLSAMATVAEIAKERSGGHRGFDCVLMFAKCDDLLEFIPSYPGSILQEPDEFVKHYFAYLKSNDLTKTFIKKVLLTAIDQGPADVRGLAGRIFQQMEADDANSGTVRRPTMYVVGADNGVAVALAIDHRFWTEEW